MGALYKNAIYSIAFCFCILMLRLVLFPVFLEKEILISAADIVSSAAGALLYGSICTWVYRSTFGEKPKAAFFFISSLAIFLFHYVGYLALISGPESGTVYRWGELLISKGQVQPIGFLLYALNPFFVLFVYALACVFKARVART